MTKRLYFYCLVGAALCFALYLGLLFISSQQPAYNGLLLTVGLILLGLGFRGYSFLSGFSYTVMIFAAVAASMYYPAYFTQIGSFRLSNLITPLLMIIMFGMGATLSWRDFQGVVKMPRGVLIGVICQFSIMPFVGLAVSKSFGFSPEVAAGIILVGSSPSGLASNVMAYLARANLALSVTLTTVATLLAPLMTPFLMQMLAGQYVPVDFLGMMWSITRMVIIPVIAGLLFNHYLSSRFPWVERLLPLLSMGGIALIISIITAAGRDDLLTIGLALIGATLLHNLAGYFLGYWGGRLLRMPESDCRTVALEVGMQNGGLASALAMDMVQKNLATVSVALAPAVFGPMMNITGSSLATWWRGRPIGATDGEGADLKPAP